MLQFYTILKSDYLKGAEIQPPCSTCSRSCLVLLLHVQLFTRTTCKCDVYVLQYSSMGCYYGVRVEWFCFVQIVQTELQMTGCCCCSLVSEVFAYSELTEVPKDSQHMFQMHPGTFALAHMVGAHYRKVLQGTCNGSTLVYQLNVLGSPEIRLVRSNNKRKIIHKLNLYQK